MKDPESTWQIFYRSFPALIFAVVGAVIWLCYSLLMKTVRFGRTKHT